MTPLLRAAISSMPTAELEAILSRIALAYSGRPIRPAAAARIAAIEDELSARYLAQPRRRIRPVPAAPGLGNQK